MSKMIPEYKEEVRKRIVAAGFDVMCEKGYYQTTMDDIADRLGVSKPALYRYFKNKDELVVESSRNFKAVFMEKAKSMPPSSKPLDAWNSLFDLYMDFDAKFFALYFELLAMADKNPQLKTTAKENLMGGFEMSMQRTSLYQKKGLVPEEKDAYTIALTAMSLFIGMRALVVLGIDLDEIHKRWNDIGRNLYGL